MTSASITHGPRLGTLAPDIGGLLAAVRPRRKGIEVTDAEDPLLSSEEAAELADVDPSTLWRAAKRGEIRYFEVGGSPKRGGNRRYRREDVEKWARGRRKVNERLEAVEKRLDETVRRLDEHERDHP